MLQYDKEDIYSHLKKVIFLAITEYRIPYKKEGYKSVYFMLKQKIHERELKNFLFIFFRDKEIQ